MADAVKRPPDDEDDKEEKQQPPPSAGATLSTIAVGFVVEAFVCFVSEVRKEGLRVETKTKKLLERLTDSEHPLSEPYDSDTLDDIEEALLDLSATAEGGVLVAKIGLGGICVAALGAIVLPGLVVATITLGGIISTGVGWSMSSKATAMLDQLRQARKSSPAAEDPGDVVD